MRGMLECIAEAGRRTSLRAYARRMGIWNGRKLSYKSSNVADNVRVMQLIQAYKESGHLLAEVDPLGIALQDPMRAPHYLQDVPCLWPGTYGLLVDDHFKQQRFWIGDALHPLLPAEQESHTFEKILDALRRAFCGSVGTQYTHMTRANDKAWIERRILEHANFKWDNSRRREILRDLARANYFEEYFGERLSGAKRFSLEGSDALIPGLEALLKKSAELDIQVVEMGMTHRGRLNVLRNVLNVPLDALLYDFQPNASQEDFVNLTDDVRYHLGTSSQRKFPDGRKIQIFLAANPSHLESIDAVVLGKVRARQFLLRGNTLGDDLDSQHHDMLPRIDQKSGSVDYSPSDWARSQVMGVLLHGDASFFQGSVREVLGFSGLRDYTTGGTVHIVLNNQIGFTTLPKESHSGVYCTDVAMSIGAPIFHVNGDDPDAVAMVCATAVEYRHLFQRDCVVDIWSYRRHGHNEQDDPKLTQPLMYSHIESHPRLCHSYYSRLCSEGVLSKNKEKSILDDTKSQVGKEYEQFDVNSKSCSLESAYKTWSELGIISGAERESLSKMIRTELLKETTTGVEVEVLRAFAKAIFSLPNPPQFYPHPKVSTMFSDRLRSTEIGAGSSVKWATAEALAFASLLVDGFRIRLSGQDVERGTFNQRHAVLYDQKHSVLGNEAIYKPWTALQNITDLLEFVRENLLERARKDFGCSGSLSHESSEESDECLDGVIYAGPYSFANTSSNDDAVELNSTTSVIGSIDGLKRSRSIPQRDFYSLPDNIVLSEETLNNIEKQVEEISSSMNMRNQLLQSARKVLEWSRPRQIASQLPSKCSGLVEMEICNSPLSEEAVMGFEHGYSLYSTDIMSIFEYQFGDFSNCAQTVIDTFIASGEEKWARPSGMIILCPHGYEGQGPDHSSARIERFLQLCNESHDIAFDLKDMKTVKAQLASVNMHVLNMTTPAQYFHSLRRHMLLPIRKPLVIFTPKFLLHHRWCSSALEEFGPDHAFKSVIADKSAETNPEKVKRVILCSGKIWYHLFQRRKANQLDSSIALIRIEQLCPFPYSSLKKAIESYFSNGAYPVELVWVQEEPQNMGCWTYVEPRIRSMISNMQEEGSLSEIQANAFQKKWSKHQVSYCGRPFSASPATGSFQVHQSEMNSILNAALRL